MPEPEKIKKTDSQLKKVGAVGLTAGRWLFDLFTEMVDAMPGIETPYAHIRRLNGWPKEIPRRRIHEEIKRMKHRGWIIEAEKQGKRFVKLTEKGRLELLYRKLQVLGKTTDKKWDGGWWMALYDIPEHGRNERHAIRDALHLAGFYPLQKSVYVHPYKVPNELAAYLKDAKLLDFIRFVHIDHMDGAREIEKHFGLRRLGKRWYGSKVGKVGKNS